MHEKISKIFEEIDNADGNAQKFVDVLIRLSFCIGIYVRNNTRELSERELNTVIGLINEAVKDGFNVFEEQLKNERNVH